jgi:uncharacterized protein YyaL (SSP411 family)
MMAGMNRLSSATSIYLLQHKDNPVEWHEWGAGAFGEARRRGVPVLLSVGYASCHWCHVMAHESFEDPGIADVINRDFVPIKVDREERPDIDAIYMSATQALTGQGGWPMTVFLTPDGEPFYAGTYFPPTPRSGLPGFGQVLQAVAEAWAKDPDGVRSAAGRIASAVRDSVGELPVVPISAEQLDQACRALVAQIDRTNGGFGRAPKFPPSMAMEFLLRHHERTGSGDALAAVSLTLERMARGGIYDQLAGGFARYSVDATWHVPHFEKMLDDNALLLRVYAHHARLAGSGLSLRIAHETGDFLLRDLRTEDGAFAASLDADAGGVEGLTYRWTVPDLLAAAGGESDGSGGDEASGRVLALFGVDPDRPDPEGEVLRLPADPEDPVAFARLRERLLRVRAGRPQPGRDDIVVLRSNGLAIAGLAEAGAALDRPDWIAAAGVAADALIRVHRVGDGWLRSSLHGRPGPGRATLADLAGFAGGLLALYQATGEVARLELAVEVLAEAMRDFGGPDGAWYDTATPAGEAGPVIARPRDPTDGAAPSGLSSAADALLTASALTGSAEFRQAAEQAIASVGSLILRFPRSAGWHLSVAEALASGPLQVAVAGPAGPNRESLAEVARRRAPGGSVIEVGDPDDPGRPLLADRPGVDGRAAAYVCRGFVCDRPVSDPTDLVAALASAEAR